MSRRFRRRRRGRFAFGRCGSSAPFFQGSGSPCGGNRGRPLTKRRHGRREKCDDDEGADRAFDDHGGWLKGIVAAYHGKPQSAIHHVSPSGLAGKIELVPPNNCAQSWTRRPPALFKTQLCPCSIPCGSIDHQLNSGAKWSPAAAACRPCAGSPACSAAHGFRADGWRIRQ